MMSKISFMMSEKKSNFVLQSHVRWILGPESLWSVSMFRTAIESMGGEVYNGCCGILPDGVIYFGGDSLVVNRLGSFEDCVRLKERFEKILNESVA